MRCRTEIRHRKSVWETCFSIVKEDPFLKQQQTSDSYLNLRATTVTNTLRSWGEQVKNIYTYIYIDIYNHQYSTVVKINEGQAFDNVIELLIVT